MFAVLNGSGGPGGGGATVAAPAFSLAMYLIDLLAEMDAEYGPPTAEDNAWAERALGLRP